MDILLLLFAALAACVLVGLSLLVLEYQNIRSRKWLQMWDNGRPLGPHPSKLSSTPESDPEPEEIGVLMHELT